MRTLPSEASYRRATSDVIVVLPAPDGPDQRHQLTRLHAERHAVEHRLVGRGLERRDGLERGERHLVGRRVAEADVVELDRRRAAREGLGVGLLDDHRRQVEHLEDPLEGHQRRHDVDPDVRQGGQRAVEPAEQSGERDEGARR